MWPFFRPTILRDSEYPSRAVKCEMMVLGLPRGNGNDSHRIWNASFRVPHVTSKEAAEETVEYPDQQNWHTSQILQ